MVLSLHGMVCCSEDGCRHGPTCFQPPTDPTSYSSGHPCALVAHSLSVSHNNLCITCFAANPSYFPSIPTCLCHTHSTTLTLALPPLTLSSAAFAPPSPSPKPPPASPKIYVVHRAVDPDPAGEASPASPPTPTDDEAAPRLLVPWVQVRCQLA